MVSLASPSEKALQKSSLLLIANILAPILRTNTRFSMVPISLEATWVSINQRNIGLIVAGDGFDWLIGCMGQLKGLLLEHSTDKSGMKFTSVLKCAYIVVFFGFLVFQIYRLSITPVNPVNSLGTGNNSDQPYSSVDDSFDTLTKDNVIVENSISAPVVDSSESSAGKPIVDSSDNVAGVEAVTGSVSAKDDTANENKKEYSLAFAILFANIVILGPLLTITFLIYWFAPDSFAWRLICAITAYSLFRLSFSYVLILFLFSEFAYIIAALRQLVLPFLFAAFLDLLLWPFYLILYGLACLLLLWLAKLTGYNERSKRFNKALLEMWEEWSIGPAGQLTWRDHFMLIQVE